MLFSTQNGMMVGLSMVYCFTLLAICIIFLAEHLQQRCIADPGCWEFTIHWPKFVLLPAFILYTLCFIFGHVAVLFPPYLFSTWTRSLIRKTVRQHITKYSSCALIFSSPAYMKRKMMLAHCHNIVGFLCNTSSRQLLDEKLAKKKLAAPWWVQNLWNSFSAFIMVFVSFLD